MDTTPGRAKRAPTYPRPASDRVAAIDEESDKVKELPAGDTEIAGIVTHINAERDNWTAGRLRTQHGEVKFAGAVVGLAVNERAKLLGKFVNHPKWGQQFEVKTGSKDLPTDSEGFVALLMSDDRFKGIGPVRAQAILDVCDALGMELEDALATEKDRDRLAQRANVPRAVIENLGEMWQKSAAENQAKAKLLSLGITTNAANKIAKKYGAGRACDLIREDPYFLYREVEGFGFKKADAIAAKQGIKKTAKCRLTAGILCAVEEALQDGHTWTLRSEVLKRTWKILGLKSDEEKDKTRDLLDELEDQPNEHGLAFSELDEKRIVARAGVLKRENDLVQRLAAAPTNVKWPALTFDERLNEQQRAAVLLALEQTRLVITGPAGVGKTFIVGKIIKAYEAVGKVAAVCAPTGKAAKRLEETFARQGDQRNAYTIHRLLAYGYNKGTGFKGFQYNAINPHPADIIICDEASMLDVSLAWHLTDALKPGACLVLVGDHNQIPPVGAGAVLRDLVKTRLCPVAELTEVVRQAGVLRQNSLRVLKGQLSPTAKADPETGLSPWVIVDSLARPSECLKTVLGLMEKRLDRYGADALLNTQIIAPQRKGEVGIEKLNVEIQRLVQKKLYGIEVGEKGNTKLLVGDKVMATANDYELGLMNGDQGIVAGEEKENLLMSLGTGDLAQQVSIPKKQTGGIVLAYAITVHKAQGSEWDFVIGVCHRSHVYMWHRNLLYTLVTRGAKGTCVLGDPSGIRMAVNKVDAQARRTMLSRAAPKSLPSS
jgi:exodeoxyribonuclease V alpha subunit